MGGSKQVPAERGLRWMRREVAVGTTPVSAVVQRAETASGAADRALSWRSLRAGQLGMSGELFDLLSEPDVTDVLINGTEAWVDRGSGCQRVELERLSEFDTRRLAVQMAAAAGQRLDDASPLVDAFLGDNIRLHAVLPPLSREGPLISLRVLRRGGYSLTQLVELDTCTPELGRVLAGLVKNRVSVLISGATGAGKTTLLSALLQEVDEAERIICIEEVSELFPTHPHVVHLQERQANVEGVGQVTLVELVRAALRMRPDRLVLGECRGPEVREVLPALNTGHSGGFTTLHANSLAAVPSRMVALGQLAGLSKSVLTTQVATAFQAVVHLGRGSDGQRRVLEVGLLREEHGLGTVPAWQWSAGEYRAGPAQGQLAALIGEDPLGD